MTKRSAPCTFAHVLSARQTFAPEIGFLALRITWLNWLAALTLLFAYPVMILELPWVHELVVVAYGSVGACVRDDCAPESWLNSHTDWSWHDLVNHYPVWLSLILAAIVPMVLHWRRRNRLKPVFERWPRAPGSDEPLTYRATTGYSVHANPPAFAAHLYCFASRMILAMLLSGVAFYELFGARLIKNYGCVWYNNLYSVPEYIVYVGLMLGVVLTHMPSPRQVFGSSVSDFKVWRRNGVAAP